MPLYRAKTTIAIKLHLMFQMLSWIENPYLPFAFNRQMLLFRAILFYSVYKSKPTGKTDALHTKNVLPVSVHLAYPITGNSEHESITFRRDHARLLRETSRILPNREERLKAAKCYSGYSGFHDGKSADERS